MAEVITPVKQVGRAILRFEVGLQRVQVNRSVFLGDPVDDLLRDL